MRIPILRPSHFLSAHRTSTARFQSSISERLVKLEPVFPEIKTSTLLAASGKFREAERQLKDIHDILVNATGKNSKDSVALAWQRASFWRRLGDWNKVNEIIQTHVVSADNSDVTSRVLGLQLQAVSLLENCELEAALRAADAAIEESERTPDSNLSLFSCNYSLKGLIMLYSNQPDEAETYLQLAARWSRSRRDEVTALTNLGSLQWVLSSPPRPSWGEYEYMRGMPIPTTTDNSKIPEKQRRFVCEASVEYWDEAVLVATSSSNQGAESAAAAMCGPVSAGDMLGPDKSVSYRTVPSSSPTSIATAATTTEDNSTPKPSSLNDLLTSDSLFASSYLTLLCNLAEAKFHQDGDCLSASPLLSTAIKATEAQPADDGVCGPVVGRVLGLVAVAQARTGRLVTAEGLFRSALPRLKGPYATADPRYRFELAMMTGAYGQLLKGWEKRGEEGDKVLRTAAQLMAELPSYPHHSHFSSFLILPL